MKALPWRFHHGSGDLPKSALLVRLLTECWF
ncbi:hypothetical protein KR100_10800 [Synechococcus sp. KORDI-100]|nr:hypothetical protein KR100_10800 [Synechococcus sp. KORDI-100]